MIQSEFKVYWIGLLFMGYSATGQNLRITHLLEDTVSICGQAQLRIELENASGSDVVNAALELYLPEGTNYLAGSIQNASELDLTIPHRPIFKLATFLPRAKRTLRLGFFVTCSLFDQVNSGSLFRNKIRLTYDGGQDSLVTDPPYPIETGFLVIQSVNDTSVEAGTDLYRKIRITNSRLGPIRNFTFEDRHDSIIVSSATGKTAYQDPVILRLELDGGDFVKTGDRDSLLERDEFIEIEEWVSDTSCASKTIGSMYSAFWSCAGNVCQGDEESSEIDFIQPIRNARLSFSTGTNADDCYCTPDGHLFYIDIQNTGTRKADGLQLSLQSKRNMGPGDTLAFIVDSFRIDGPVAISSLVPSGTYTGQLCTPAELANDVDVYIHSLLPGQKVRLYGRILINPDVPASQLVFYYKYRYFTFCKSNPTASPDLIPVAIDLSSTKTFYHELKLPGSSPIFKHNQTYVVYDSIRILRNIADKPIHIQIAIPCGLMLADTSFFLGGKVPAKRQINISGATLVNLQYDPPFLVQNYLLPIRVIADCNQPCLQSLGPSSRKFITSCPQNKEEKAVVNGLLCSVVSSPCYFSDSCACGPSQIALQGFELDCPDEQGVQDTIPIYAGFNSDVYRVNVYDADVDSNRLSDGTGRADTSMVAIRNFITGDTLANAVKSGIIAFTPGYTADSISFLFSIGVPLNPISGKLRYYHAASQRWFQCNVDTIVEYKSPAVSPGCGKVGLKRKNYGSGYAATLTRESLILNCGLPNDHEIADGDSFELEVLYTFKGSVNDRIFSTKGVNYIQVFNRGRGFLFPYSCHSESQVLKFATPGWEVMLPSTDVYYCNRALQLSPVVIRGNGNLSDFFTREFRRIIHFDSIKYFLAPDLKLDTLWTYSYYFNGLSDTLIRRDYFIPDVVNNVYFFPAGRLAKLSWDEAFRIECIPHILVDRCGALKDDKVQITFQYVLSSESDSTFWIAPDVIHLQSRWNLTSSLEYHLLNPGARLRFDQKELYISSRQLEWDLMYPSGLDGGYLKITMGSASGLVDQFAIRSTPPVNIRSLRDSCFLIGPFENDSNYILEMKAIEMSCNKDTLRILTSWSCDSLALIADFDTCLLHAIEIPVIPAKPELELDLAQEQIILKLCDTLPEMELEFFNADKGSAYQPELIIEVPAGIILITGSAMVSYPAGSPYRPFPMPEWLIGNRYIWRFDQLIPELATRGLQGIQYKPANSIRIKFRAASSCEIAADNYFVFTARGLNLCENTSNIVRKAGGEILIEGLTRIPKGHADLTLKHPLACEPGKVTCHARLEFDQETQSDDSCVIYIPKPFAFVANSFMALENISAPPKLRLSEYSDHWELHLALDPGIASGQPIRFGIDLDGYSPADCGDYAMQLNTFTRRTAFCVTSQSECQVYASTSEAKGAIAKNLAVAGFSFFKADEQHDGRLKFEAGILTENMELFPDSELCLGIFIDRPASGSLGKEDSLVKLIKIPVDSLKAHQELILNTFIDGPFPLNCNFLIALPEPVCICSSDTLATRRVLLPGQFFYDTLCAGDSILLGGGISALGSYKWDESTFLCDSCRFQWYGAKGRDSIFLDTLKLTISSGSDCMKDYTYIILNLQPSGGLHNQILACRDEEIELDAGSKVNYYWRGPGIVDPLKKTQRILVRDSLRYFLEYDDVQGCRSTDTFVVNYWALPGALGISPDTTIRKGDKAQLYVTPGYRYLWSPGHSLSCDDCPDPEAFPETTTEYSVIVTDSMDCTYLLRVTVRVLLTDCDQLPVGVPNAFSPNGDHVNDFMFVRGAPLQQFYFRIVDRWGETVFESRDQNKAWDGRYHGKLLGPDVFGYILQYDCEGRQIVRVGNISLLK